MISSARFARSVKWGLVLALATATAMISAAPAPADWPMFGQNLANTASTSGGLTPENVGELGVKWTATTHGDVSARAAVVKGVVYFPDWGGNLSALSAGNGNVLWSRQLSSYGLTGSSNGVYHSRTTPAIDKGTLYLGTQEGAYVLAINAASGNLLWKKQIEAGDPYAIITTSPAVSNGVVYTGVASIAEAGTLYGINPIPAVRGSAVALNAATGAINWKTYTIPAGYSGGGVWGSNPVVDASRNTVFISTGNNYRHPDAGAESSTAGVTYGACIAGGGTATTCNSPNNHEDSVLALDLTTGVVKWSHRLVTWNQPFVADGSDDWNVDCAFGGSQCPSNPGPDYDFASTPNLITYQSATGPKTILGAGQKSGIYYAMNPDTGGLLWQTQVGPGSSLGGMEWGSASDGVRIYVQVANLYGLPHAVGNAGLWAALDPATGAIVWQTADPSGSIALGPLSVANGVVFANSMAGGPAAPTMLALDGATGAILWSFASGASVNAGATIVDDTVFWGSGYTHLGIPGFTGNDKFYAFKRIKK
jgi:polyvinyl alcohol dehydrogenase (cytochrome)